MSIFHRWGTRSFWLSLGMVLLFNGWFLVWLLLKPGSHNQLVAIDDIGQAGGYLLGALLCLGALHSHWRYSRNRSPAESNAGVGASQRWALILLGLALISDCIGQVIYTYYDVPLGQLAPYPSWADVFFLLSYPLQLLGILLLPVARRLVSGTTRSRVLLDGLMIMTAVITFSWYFILGPTTLQGSGTILAKLVGTAYPFFDLVMIFCVLLLSFRSSNPALRPAIYLLSLALTIVAISDSITQYQTLQSTYATGSLLDLGWPLGYSLIGLAVQAMCVVNSGQGAIIKTAVSKDFSRRASIDLSSAWRSFLPYALVPATMLLAIFTWHTGGNGLLAQGVYLGGIIVIGLVLMRQLLSVREAKQLNKALRTVNTRLESLATTDPLTELPNHRALLDHLDVEIDRARRSGRTVAVVFFDGDHFKRINDTYGHAVGDAVLHELGVRVDSVLRPGDKLGRYGGEEFLVILPETTTEQACAVAERMRAVVATIPLDIAQVADGIIATISLGIASFPADGATGSEVLEQADKAMYWAKRLGRNQVRTTADAARANRNTALAGTLHALERQDEKSVDGMHPEQALRTDQLSMLHSLMWVLELRDRGISNHSYQVSDLATAIAQQMGLDQETVFAASTAALLHDIGKIGVPDAILHKAGQFTATERAIIKQHPELGAQILEENSYLQHLAPAVHYHHERWDGAGYPEQLGGAFIPLEARIIAVAEAYHAILSDHSYQPSRTSEAALAELQRCAGTQFDPTVVQAASVVLTNQLAVVGTLELSGAG